MWREPPRSGHRSPGPPCVSNSLIPILHPGWLTQSDECAQLKHTVNRGRHESRQGFGPDQDCSPLCTRHGHVDSVSAQQESHSPGYVAVDDAVIDTIAIGPLALGTCRPFPRVRRQPRCVERVSDQRDLCVVRRYHEEIAAVSGRGVEVGRVRPCGAEVRSHLLDDRCGLYWRFGPAA